MKKICRSYDIKRWPYRNVNPWEILGACECGFTPVWQIQSLQTKAGNLGKLDAAEAVWAVEKVQYIVAALVLTCGVM